MTLWPLGVPSFSRDHLANPHGLPGGGAWEGSRFSPSQWGVWPPSLAGVGVGASQPWRTSRSYFLLSPNEVMHPVTETQGQEWSSKNACHMTNLWHSYLDSPGWFSVCLFENTLVFSKMEMPLASPSSPHTHFGWSWRLSSTFLTAGSSLHRPPHLPPTPRPSPPRLPGSLLGP